MKKQREIESKNLKIARVSSTEHSAWHIKTFNQWSVNGELLRHRNHYLKYFHQLQCWSSWLQALWYQEWSLQPSSSLLLSYLIFNLKELHGRWHVEGFWTLLSMLSYLRESRYKLWSESVWLRCQVQTNTLSYNTVFEIARGG